MTKEKIIISEGTPLVLHGLYEANLLKGKYVSHMDGNLRDFYFVIIDMKDDVHDMYNVYVELKVMGGPFNGYVCKMSVSDLDYCYYVKKIGSIK